MSYFSFPTEVIVMREAFQAWIGSTHEAFVFDRRSRVLSNAIVQLFPPASTIVDIGCGDGTIAALWMEQRSDIRVEGIDVLIRGQTKIPVQHFDGIRIPFADKSFDAVSFVDVLHHTNDPAALLSEAARVARKRVVVKDHYAETFFDGTTLRFMDWFGNAHHGVSLPNNYKSRLAWETLFKETGLTLLALADSFPLYPFPANLLFGRGLHFVASLSPGKFSS
jgi:SAM-dependent methyltransferase